MNFWIYAFSLSLACSLWILPKRWRFAMGSFLGWVWFDLLKLRRRTVLRNLTIAFPDFSHERRMEIARKSMAYLCYNFIEFSLIPLLDKKWLQEEVIFHGFENYEAAAAKGKGLLLMSLHMGNGDVGTAALVLKGLKMSLISKKFKNRLLNQFWFGVREKKGTRFLEPHGRSTAFDILRICRAQLPVIFVVDQFMGRPYGIDSTFFGKKTGTAYGLALFAMKTQAPVVPIYTYRDSELKTHVVFENEVTFEKIEDKDLQIKLMTQKYNDRVESIVRKFPEQWMWVHRRWKKWE